MSSAGRLSATSHELREGFVLIGGDHIDAGVEGCFPAGFDGRMGAEVIAIEPALVFLRREAVQSVEANPVPELMGVVDESLQTGVFVLCPGAGFGLAFGFDFVP